MLKFAPLFLLLPLLCTSLSTGPVGPQKERLPDLPDDIRQALSSAPLARSTPDIVIRSWMELLNRGPMWAESWASRVQERLDRVFDHANHTLISSTCRQSLARSIESMKRLDTWAIKRKTAIIFLHHQCLLTKSLSLSHPDVSFMPIFTSFFLTTCKNKHI